MDKRALGKNGPFVSALGLGCMGMSDFYGPREEAESLATLNHALDRGVDFLDTADMYGFGENEELLAKLLLTRRREVFLATKFGFIRDRADPGKRAVSGRPEYVRAACEASLRRLGTDVIDLYYAHRIDASVPVEETVGAMADLVRAGKVRYLGLSEAGPDSLRRATTVHPIAAVQSEYSLWSRDVEEAVLGTCRELGVAFVPYSPLGRGFLTGQFRSIADFAPDDQRRTQPRFQGDNFARNLALVDQVKALAARKGCTAAQLALAWVLAQGPDIIPIPGTRRIRNLDENLGALALKLTAGDLAELEAAFPVTEVAGSRYPEQMMKLLDTHRRA
jgi:aryl-alcohol dehydrogenase-like predicted oxidoreductase